MLDNETTYSAFRQELLLPIDSVSKIDLTSGSAGNIKATFRVPKSWGSVDILAMGFWYDAAGGAETTPGTLKLEIEGTAQKDANANPAVITCVANHTADDAVEEDLNLTSSLLSDATNQYNTAPSYPTAAYGEKITLNLGTAGVGAGDQNVWPYLLVRRHQQ